MDNVNYICINSGDYLGRDNQGKFIEQYISCGDKVYLEFLCDVRPHRINGDFSYAEKFCRCVIDDRGTEIYLKQENILKSFRPIVHKHIVTVVFKTVEEMNKWLIDKPVNSIKDIKIVRKAFFIRYLVIYIDNGDE